MPEEKKLTDNEIIKALECCSQEDMCQSCPYGAACLDDKYISIISKDALDLIKRYKEQNEQLTAELKMMMETARQYKEEAENLKIDIKAMRGAANSYKAEVERFKGVIKLLEKDVITAKSEVIKEFAMRLRNVKVYSLERHENVVPVAQIDWVGQWFIKEMAGGNENA